MVDLEPSDDAPRSSTRWRQGLVYADGGTGGEKTVLRRWRQSGPMTGASSLSILRERPARPLQEAQVHGAEGASRGCGLGGAFELRDLRPIPIRRPKPPKPRNGFFHHNRAVIAGWRACSCRNKRLVKHRPAATARRQLPCKAHSPEKPPIRPLKLLAGNSNCPPRRAIRRLISAFRGQC